MSNVSDASLQTTSTRQHVETISYDQSEQETSTINSSDHSDVYKIGTIININNRINHGRSHNEINPSIMKSNKTEYKLKESEELFSKSLASENIPVHNFILDFPQLNPLCELQTTAVLSVIQESLCYLKILKHTLRGNKDFNYNINYQSIDEKYGIIEEPKFIFREEMGLHPLVPTYSEKLLRDTNYIIEILEKTMSEIQYDGNFDSLDREVNKTTEMRKDEKLLEDNFKIWSEVSEEIKCLIKSNKLTNTKELEHLEIMIQNTKSEINAVKFKIFTITEYVKRWENNRVKEQRLFLLKKENEIYNKIAKCIEMGKNEDRIYKKLNKYLNDYIEGIEKEILEWNEKYNDEFERIQQEIVYLQEDIEDQKKEIEELISLKNNRQHFIDECFAKKEKVRIKQEYNNLLHKSAIIIQSLWRGYMVRNHLGRYKKLRTKFKARKKGHKISKKSKLKKSRR